jgi:hypothetical protein
MPSTPADDLPASGSFSARINPPRTPANTPPAFSSLAPFICQGLLRFETKDDSSRLLERQPTGMTRVQPSVSCLNAWQEECATLSRVPHVRHPVP